MKILMYSDSFGTTTTTFIRNEIEYLVNRGIEVHYLCINSSENDFSFPNFHLHQIPFMEGSFSKMTNWILRKFQIYFSFRNKKFQKALNQLVFQIKPDVIHCHFALEALKIEQNLSIQTPLVFHFHGYGASMMLKNKGYVRAINQALKKSHVRSICVSNFMTENLKKNNVKAPRNSIIFCGVNLSDFKVELVNRENEKFTFLQVSSLAFKKGHIYTLKAISEFLQQIELPENYQFIFTGSGERLTELLNLVERLNISSHVNFVGNKNKSEVISLMNQADVFLHNSITSKAGDQEGIPTAIMEAMAMNLPILATEHAGIPELVEHKINGLLAEEKNIKAYAENMLEIISWKKHEVNRQKIQSKFSFKQHGAEILVLYEQILQEQNS